MAGQVLVTGGAGYIGSHMVLHLLDAGEEPIVLDDLSTGRADAVPAGVPLVRGDVGDRSVLDRVFADHEISAIVHFAGSIVVPESVADPLKYFRNNTASSLALIAKAVEAGTSAFIFSSTAAVYGEPERVPVEENAPARPASPYGASKLMTEVMLMEAARAYGLRAAALRYFNVAGADPKGRSGQSTPEATHLIKVAMQAALGRRAHLSVFGRDYDTPDGTGVRDYIHVSDLASIHYAVLAHLRGGGDSVVLNCGYGCGFSVLEVIEAVRRTTGAELPVRFEPRRDGDVGAIVADPTKMNRLLGWTPRHDDLDEIVSHAFAWERELDARAAA